MRRAIAVGVDGNTMIGSGATILRCTSRCKNGDDCGSGRHGKVGMTKTELRREHLERRRAMPAETVVAAGKAIADRVIALPSFAAADTILSYVASKDNEVDTRRILEWALDHRKRVLVPVCLPDRALGWCHLRSLGVLAPTSFGVLEPRIEFRDMAAPPADAPVVVPGLVFDKQGYRIGYGAGYFDRFLARHEGKKMGVAYEWQVVEEVPREAHDIAMHTVVTDAGVIEVRE